ncbi:PHP domain-containing protein [Marinitoga sp. 38H-ov]|uniref:PHP domain-containing protein n=1 Tax=Marinitoga sp. 38H-ov TaxID=1755814 RepID=UPI0013ED5ACA|nr:PHP domain-containing protein [Marinitoga sp. 38H-ov]KAF2956270.1 phosphoesterase [Marinitoga sp. 38H-ov]
MIVDLHSHTTGSDGTFSPDEIINLANENNIEIFSITDHDNIDAIKELSNITEDIFFIPGVEISAEFPKTLHILGYGIDINNKELNNTLKELQDFRKNRNEKMLKNMESFGFYITMEELIEEAKGEIVGRPHFANLMVKKGYVKTYQEAFDKYLKKGAPLYMDKKRLEPEKAIELIHNAGGITVMAHPYQTKLEGNDLEELIRKLKSYGLDGIEVYYSQHTKEMIEEYNYYAKKYELVKTAGSDFHGKNKPHISLGMDIVYNELHDFLCFIKGGFKIG